MDTRALFRARLKKSVMSRLAPLSLGQRMDYQQLVNQGVPEAEARAIAQSYQSVAKSDGPSEAYYRAYHKAASNQLPTWQHRTLHKAARGSAGARGRHEVRLRSSDKQDLMSELDALRARIKVVQAEIGKSSPLASEVHVPVPLGSGDKKKKDYVIKAGDVFDKKNRKNSVTKRETAASANEMAYIQAAYSLQVPTEASDPGQGPGADTPEMAPFMQAARLVAGMDFEMATSPIDAETARSRASRTLQTRPSLYDSTGRPEELRNMRGLMLDIGSGLRREPGWLGLDLAAYDHGTVVHDVALGLPFPDASAKAIRLVNALHPILDTPGGNPDPMPLLLECQRVLQEGGYLYYAGPEPLVEDGQRWPLPGLVLFEEPSGEMNRRDFGAGAISVQVLRRVPARVPAYMGADATFAAAAPMPLDVQMAMAAYNTQPAETAVARLVQKTQGQMARIAKADTHRQIITCEVLIPQERDTQEDVMSAEDIELAAHQYLKTSRIVGSEHGRPIDASVVESYIAPCELMIGDGCIKPGTWVISIHVQDPEEWQSVLDGTYGGVSVGGVGTRDPVAA